MVREVGDIDTRIRDVRALDERRKRLLCDLPARLLLRCADPYPQLRC